jgi:hypothetical protein
LLRELSVKKNDELEDQILTVIRACDDGEAGLDQVLVGLYRKFKVVQTRRYIQNKLYRMSKKELVFTMPGHRAAYSLHPTPSPADEYDGYMGQPNEHSAPNDLDAEIPF